MLFTITLVHLTATLMICCDCSVYWQPLLQAPMDTWSTLQQEDVSS